MCSMFKLGCPWFGWMFLQMNAHTLLANMFNINLCPFQEVGSINLLCLSVWILILIKLSLLFVWNNFTQWTFLSSSLYINPYFCLSLCLSHFYCLSEISATNHPKWIKLDRQYHFKVDMHIFVTSWLSNDLGIALQLQYKALSYNVESNITRRLIGSSLSPNFHLSFKSMWKKCNVFSD